MASQAGLHKTLSSYVARHSWATLAYDKGVAMPDISVAMGHTNAQTTKIYIEQKNQMRVARANRKVIGFINEDRSVGAGNGRAGKTSCEEVRLHYPGDVSFVLASFVKDV